MANFYANLSQKAGQVIDKTKSGEKEVIKIDPKKLIDDPDNLKLNNGSETNTDEAYLSDAYTHNIKTEGQKNIIKAYLSDGKYHIISGHRTKYNAIAANVNTVEVVVIPEPKDLIERREMLSGDNIDDRDKGPCWTARNLAYDIETYRLKKERGDELESDDFVFLAAKRRGLSASMAAKYLRLNELTEELQNLANTNGFPWTALLKATQLSPEKQQALYHKIHGEMKIKGSVSASAVDDAVEYIRYAKLDGSAGKYDAAETEKMNKDLQERYGLTSPEEKAEEKSNRQKRPRSLDAIKAIQTAHEYLEKSMLPTAVIKGKKAGIERYIKELEDMQFMMTQKIEELKKQL